MAAPDQSVREKAIFEEAFDIASPEKRMQFVREACGGDDRLLDRVLALLRADEHGAHFLPDEAPDPATAAQGAVGERPGDTIGSYKLIEQIGEGGWGSWTRRSSKSPSGAGSRSRLSSWAWIPGRSWPASKQSGRRSL